MNSFLDIILTLKDNLSFFSYGLIKNRGHLFRRVHGKIITYIDILEPLKQKYEIIWTKSNYGHFKTNLPRILMDYTSTVHVYCDKYYRFISYYIW